MNYEPNNKKWKVGDYVIHDMDAKEPYMLMKVIKIQENGLYITKYAFPRMHARKIYSSWFYSTKNKEELLNKLSNKAYAGNYKNDIKYLLDPKKFSIKIPERDIVNA
jgi:hypothetical protein